MLKKIKSRPAKIVTKTMQTSKILESSKSNEQPPAKKRNTGRSAKAKGTRAEVEFARIATEMGIPTMRVVASGAIKGAEGDLKMGVGLINGEFPPPDEAVSLIRAEVKNRKDNPEWLYEELNSIDCCLGFPVRGATESLFGYLNQSQMTKAVVLKRHNTPKTALSGKDYNQAYLVVMGAKDWLELLKNVYDTKTDNLRRMAKTKKKVHVPPSKTHHDLR